VPNANLFAALRGAFPADLDACAVETDSGLFYSWRDLDQATAMVANLLESLALPKGSRIAVQVEKSVEALVLYLATLRAGGNGLLHQRCRACRGGVLRAQLWLDQQNGLFGGHILRVHAQ
jgi:non-ribosomal peptide synthetase component E (peptide arylation enzyme)